MVYTDKRLVSFFVVSIGFVLILSGCATQVDPLAEDLSMEAYFQKGMEALDKNKYELALSYYQAAQQKYPEDIDGQLWASYEIGFIYYKMNKKEKALESFNQLLERYKADEKNTYPRAPFILAEKMKTRIEAGARPK